jgi:archaellum component FlaC
VHDYIGIDLAMVYEIITQDLKTLKPKIEKIIKEKLHQKIFDIEEIKVCKESPYYEYIEFEKIL